MVFTALEISDNNMIIDIGRYSIENKNKILKQGKIRQIKTAER